MLDKKYKPLVVMTDLVQNKHAIRNEHKILVLITYTGLENSTCRLVFTSTSGCRASRNFDTFSENYFFLIYVNNFCDAGQVPIFRYFEA